MSEPEYLYRVTATAKHGFQHRHSEPSDWGRAIARANGYLSSKRYHSIVITRAETTGVNADKYFLHKIVK